MEKAHNDIIKFRCLIIGCFPNSCATCHSLSGHLCCVGRNEIIPGCKSQDLQQRALVYAVGVDAHLPRILKLHNWAGGPVQSSFFFFFSRKAACLPAFGTVTKPTKAGDTCSPRLLRLLIHLPLAADGPPPSSLPPPPFPPPCSAQCCRGSRLPGRLPEVNPYNADSSLPPHSHKRGPSTCSLIAQVPSQSRCTS